MTHPMAGDKKKGFRGIGNSPAARRRRPRPGALSAAVANVMEPLESRTMLTVTINNGLSTLVPNYFQATIGPGGSCFTAMIGQTSFITKYAGFLDTSAVAGGTAGTASVLDLSTTTGDAVAGTTANTAVATETLTIGGKNATLVVTASIAAGSDTLSEKYVLTSVTGTGGAAVLTNTRLFQYLFSDVNGATADYLTVAGANTAPTLSTVDPVNNVTAALANGANATGGNLSGYAADTYDNLETTILAGGYIPPAAGNLPSVDLPAATITGGTAGYGPGEITQAIGYTVTNAQTCTINTSLTVTGPLNTTPSMEVFGNAVLIANGDANPQTTDNTAFGMQTTPTSLQYTVENLGAATLNLTGSPIIALTGADPQDFLVTLQPLPQVGSGLTSTFTITYLPADGGTQTAIVSIANNDLTANPYTFEISGGTAGVTAPLPDVYEPDNTPAQASVIATNGSLQDHTISTPPDVDWARFNLTQTDNVVIQTNGVIGDTLLYLYNSSNTTTPIASDDNSGLLLFSRITTTLTAGTYYVEVMENGENNPIPAYTLGVVAAPVGAAAPTFFANDSNGTLIVNALDNGSVVDVASSSAMVAATVNSQTLYFLATTVDAIQVNLATGSNVVTIDATMPAATVNGGSGNDSIAATNSAGDVFYGNQGDDTLIGGSGNDSLYGGKGNNVLRGGLGDDSLKAGTGNSTLAGNQGNDTLVAGTGSDSLMGGQGNDVLRGGTGSDTINGGQGNDTITAGAGANSISGGAGNDTIFCRNGFIDTVDGGAGTNSAQYDDGPNIFDVVTNIQNVLS